MDLTSKILACHACPLRHRHASGTLPCTVDGCDIIAHAEANYCPHPEGARFGDGRIPLGWKSRGLGDTVAKIASVLHIKPCGGCKKRQAALNKVAGY